MAIKKTELYSSLWASCDELRGGMDASQYKNYILTLLFVKYVSDKYAGQKLGAIVVPEGGSFTDMVAQKGQKDIGDQFNKIIGKLASESTLPIIDLTNFCTRLSDTIWHTSQLMTKAFNPSPYCKGPCRSAGNVPFTVASQTGHCFTCASTCSTTFSNTRSIFVRRS